MGTTYGTDVVAWATEQAALLRSGQLSAIDVEHLAEEMDAMSAKEKRELRYRLAILLQHLLKWQFQPTRRSDSWTTTMFEQRLNIQDILEDSPSLAGILVERFAGAYALATRQAAMETGISLSLFPKDCPYTLAETMDDDWLPPDPHL